MNEFKIKCTLTDRSTGKTVNVDDLTDEERHHAAEKIAQRALGILYGPEYEVRIKKT